MKKDFPIFNKASEDDLIQAIRQENENAFSFLYDKYSASIFGIIKRRVNCPSAAENILQSVFLKIWANANLYSNNKERLFTWMLHIANREAINYLHIQNEKDNAASSP